MSKSAIKSHEQHLLATVNVFAENLVSELIKGALTECCQAGKGNNSIFSQTTVDVRKKSGNFESRVLFVNFAFA